MSAAAAFKLSEIFFSIGVLVLVNPKMVHNELLLQKKEKTTAKFDFSFTLLLPPQSAFFASLNHQKNHRATFEIHTKNEIADRVFILDLLYFF